MSRVRIGTCSGPADAALVRSMFSAHDIPVVIGAENHAGMLGGLGGVLLSLDIWVDEADREDAEALLLELRAQEGAAGDEYDGDGYDGDGTDDEYEAEAGDADGEGDPDRLGDHTGARAGAQAATGEPDLASIASTASTAPADARADDAPRAGQRARPAGRGPRPGPGDSVRLRTERRRRTGIALLLGCFLTFGTAHMSTGAWARGIALAGLEVLGFLYVGVRPELGVPLVAVAILTDLIGALWRVRTAWRVTLPEARVRGP